MIVYCCCDRYSPRPSSTQVRQLLLEMNDNHQASSTGGRNKSLSGLSGDTTATTAEAITIGLKVHDLAMVSSW